MSSPLQPQEGNWWHVPVSRHERIWLWISLAAALVLFAVMTAWTVYGEQNQTGVTYRISPQEFQKKVNSYVDEAAKTEQGIRPPADDIYIGAARFSWIGLPVVLEAGKTYDVHLGSFDVQHGFSVRPAQSLSKQMSLQVLPGYEWVLPMTFDEPGTYHVVCNEFCGVGHRSMHGTFIVEE